MERLRIDKKAYLFSVDAFIALLIILGVVFFIKPPSSQVTEEIHLQEDLIEVLSKLKIGEIDNSQVQVWISNGVINNPNQSVLQQLGEFFVVDRVKAEILAEEILGGLSLDENIGIYFNNQLIANSNSSSFQDSYSVWTSRQIVSGVEEGEGVTGYSSRASLFSLNKVEYFYFGGYIGDGNITLDLGPGVTSAKIEGAFSGSFDLYVNGLKNQTYNPPPNIPYGVDLKNSLFQVQDPDIIEFRSVSGGGGLYIAGGYVKAIYNSSQVLESSKRKKLPGVEGIINLYDSFYIPGTLDSMEVSFKYNSSYDIFFNIGNKTLYSGDSGGLEETVFLDDSYLSSIINYSSLTEKTVPIRLGLEGVSLFSNETKVSDVFSCTDLSSSMNAQVVGGLKIIDLVKEANRAFIDVVLHETENRVGLVGYNKDANEDYYHSLSQDEDSLKSKVDSWGTKADTCVCCGINRAVQGILEESNTNRSRSIVVMTDGNANEMCAEQGTGSATQDAIKAACDAFNDHGIRVYSIGFGDQLDVNTLESIASCAGGSYHYGDVSELVDMYKQVAGEIILASYVEQTVIGEDLWTKLYPDSYIFLNYTKDIPHELVVSAETEVFGMDFEGNLSVPVGGSVYEANVISYSGSKWTDEVRINGENIFNLSIYTSDTIGFVDLGDPYVVNIPVSKINEGDNSVEVDIGLNESDSYQGSIYNKVIYSLIKELPSFTDVRANAEGCVWTIEFEDGTVETNIRVPQNYTGSNICFFTSSYCNKDETDAINEAVFYLLESLDFNDNCKIEAKFSEDDLTMNSVQVEGIPYILSAEAQVMVWR